MSIEKRLFEIARETNLPVSPIILDWHNEIINIVKHKGREYLGRESHIKAIAYRRIEYEYLKRPKATIYNKR